MKFAKIQGNGNDFIVIENIHEGVDSNLFRQLAPILCSRKLSLGGDGILVLEKSSIADFRMRLFNRDGSEGEMCGNGARCSARYAFERGIGGEEMSFETMAGLISATVNGREVTLDLGRIDLSEAIWSSSMKIQDEVFEYSYLWVGVPHCVIFLPDLEERDRENLRKIGETARRDYASFPGGTNVNFVQILDSHTLRTVTYERGVEDLTMSCGTGSTASAIAAHLIHHVDQPVEVLNPGGVNVVGLDLEENHLFCRATLKGKTLIVAEGEFTSEALESPFG